ncbi:MAG: hypothetical protein IPL65_18465 [Lewinellaceae bacterium]|nr:hypothetical protein [Lewinellaceae bacterium]
MTGYTQHMLLKDTDQMGMASGLEVRVPFFDNDLVQYVLSIPDQFKIPHTPKALLVDALDDLLPPEIVNRPKWALPSWESHSRSPQSFWPRTPAIVLRPQHLQRQHGAADVERFSAAKKGVLWSQI